MHSDMCKIKSSFFFLIPNLIFMSPLCCLDSNVSLGWVGSHFTCLKQHPSLFCFNHSFRSKRALTRGAANSAIPLLPALILKWYRCWMCLLVLDAWRRAPCSNALHLCLVCLIWPLSAGFLILSLPLVKAFIFHFHLVHLLLPSPDVHLTVTMRVLCPHPRPCSQSALSASRIPEPHAKKPSFCLWPLVSATAATTY